MKKNRSAAVVSRLLMSSSNILFALFVMILKIRAFESMKGTNKLWLPFIFIFGGRIMMRFEKMMKSK